MVESLLAASADCDTQNSNGNTPLHLAAGKGWGDIVERFLVAGADVHIRNSKGWTSIQVGGCGWVGGRAGWGLAHP